MVVYTLWCSVVPVLFVRVPGDSREQHCSSCRFPGKSPYSSPPLLVPSCVGFRNSWQCRPIDYQTIVLGNHLRACGDRHICVKVSCVCECLCVHVNVFYCTYPEKVSLVMLAMLSQDSSAQIEQDVVETSAPLSAWLSVPGFVYCDGNNLLA